MNSRPHPYWHQYYTMATYEISHPGGFRRGIMISRGGIEAATRRFPQHSPVPGGPPDGVGREGTVIMEVDAIGVCG